ncbi:farnesol dehydrogenase-like [Bombus bifarius]|uniref:Farnesol dehydrogenase-like n=1 Tax=Bombus bifarius TaxID=103933 RepID=A0A6P8LNK2_9HYME|nr:farnesol dehydrogenase-like [Bombus bifarius]XP_033299865.1 farnesol dehydrogenase-like [Bombus bifarius]
MNYWSGKVAIVTGASAGIGLAISKELAKYGINVIGLARSMDELVEASIMIGEYFFPFQCDVTDEDEILVAFTVIEEKFGGVDILVNNTGIINYIHVMDSDTDEIHNAINTNLLAPTILAREAMNSIRKRDARGHIINISGTPGLYLEAESVPMGMYGPSKCGLRALGVELRREIAQSKLNIKVTTIIPGFVQLDMLTESYNFVGIPLDDLLTCTDIAETVICVLGTSNTVEISEITVLSQGMGSNAVIPPFLLPD